MTQQAEAESAVLHRMSLLDRWLPLWIGAAMLAGLLLGRLVPGVQDVLRSGDRRHLVADRAGSARHDVPGAGQGPV